MRKTSNYQKQGKLKETNCQSSINSESKILSPFNYQINYIQKQMNSYSSNLFFTEQGFSTTNTSKIFQLSNCQQKETLSISSPTKSHSNLKTNGKKLQITYINSKIRTQICESTTYVSNQMIYSEKTIEKLSQFSTNSKSLKHKKIKIITEANPETEIHAKQHMLKKIGGKRTSLKNNTNISDIQSLFLQKKYIKSLQNIQNGAQESGNDNKFKLKQIFFNLKTQSKQNYNKKKDLQINIKQVFDKSQKQKQRVSKQQDWIIVNNQSMYKQKIKQKDFVDTPINKLLESKDDNEPVKKEKFFRHFGNFIKIQ